MTTNIRVKGVKEAFAKMQAQLDKEVQEKFKNEVKSIRHDLVEATPKDTGRASKGWEEVNNLDGTISFVNKVPYVESLNNGHSRQAPARFIEKTILSHPAASANGVIVKSN